MTLEILGDTDAVAPISESLAAQGRGEPGADMATEAVAGAVLEFCDAALAVNPHRVGKPLFGPLAGCHGARRGTYRIVYRIDENSRVVHILDVAGRTARSLRGGRRS